MDDKGLRHLRQLTAELRQFPGVADKDVERILDSIETVIDSMRSTMSERRTSVNISGSLGFLSLMPEWVVIYEMRAQNRVVWYNPSLERVSGLPLTKALSGGLCRGDLIDEGRSAFNMGGVYDSYCFFGNRTATGIAHPFEFFYRGIQYLADITFDFDHYFNVLDGQGPWSLQSSPVTTVAECGVDGLLDVVLENLPLPAALKYPDGSVVWCNEEYLRLVHKINPRLRRYRRCEELNGQTSVRLFQLASEEAQLLTNLEAKVVDEVRPLVAYDLLHSERRLTLRFPITDANGKVRFFGVLSMPD